MVATTAKRNARSEEERRENHGRRVVKRKQGASGGDVDSGAKFRVLRRTENAASVESETENRGWQNLAEFGRII